MVTDVRYVAPDFHARYKALERTYVAEYTIQSEHA
jgi:tRNA U38,U39,U40 pseudouridine synthase TruA